MKPKPLHLGFGCCPFLPEMHRLMSKQSGGAVSFSLSSQWNLPNPDTQTSHSRLILPSMMNDSPGAEEERALSNGALLFQAGPPHSDSASFLLSRCWGYYGDFFAISPLVNVRYLTLDCDTFWTKDENNHTCTFMNVRTQHSTAY